MAARKIKDAKDLSTNELIYFKGHAKAPFMSDGRTVEDALNNISQGGGGGVTAETDPIFSASAAASITEEKKAEWDNKMDKVTLATVATSGSYNDLSDKPTIPDVSGKQDTLVSGTNIKTINGTSILGSGDITISSGQSDKKEVIYVGDPIASIANMKPNVVYWFAGAMGVTIESFEAPSGGETYDVFTAIIMPPGMGEVSLSLPEDVRFANGEVPTVNADDYCLELSISRISDDYGSYSFNAVLTKF